MIRVWVIPFSTNVERVSLALAHKGLEAERIEVDPDDRAEVERVSGQRLVPVAEIGGEIVSDSTAILRKLEEVQPENPLWPPPGERRAAVEIFLEWFDHVWKVAPNTIASELERPEPDQLVIEAHSRRLDAGVRLFDALLEERAYLFGDSLSVADCVAFPFLKYATMRDPADHELFHCVLEDHQRLGGDEYPNLRTWTARVNGHPRAF